MANNLTPGQVTEKLKNVSSNRLLTTRRLSIKKYGVTGPQIDAELHRRIAAKTK